MAQCPGLVARRPVSPRRRLLTDALLIGAGIAGWLFYAVISTAVIVVEPQRDNPQLAWQYDWHVYVAGARDLLERDLYRTPLTLDGHPMPVDVFNQTPLTALWALPLAPFDVVTGGHVWLGLMVLSIGAGMAFAAASLRWRMPVITAGIPLLAYTLSPWFLPDVLLGNINGLMFLLVAAYLWLHVRGFARAGGLLLGVAIATKLWPLAFLPLLARERRWREMTWAGGFAVAQGVLFLVWLGPDVLPSMAPAMTSPVPIEPGVPVLGWSLLRETFGLPGWLGAAAGLLLLAVPARGHIGFGIAILAGLTLFIANLWQHYLPVVTLAIGLVVGPLLASVRAAFIPSAKIGHDPPQGRWPIERE